jgi:hypothetical protein
VETLKVPVSQLCQKLSHLAYLRRNSTPKEDEDEDEDEEDDEDEHMSSTTKKENKCNTVMADEVERQRRRTLLLARHVSSSSGSKYPTTAASGSALVMGMKGVNRYRRSSEFALTLLTWEAQHMQTLLLVLVVNLYERRILIHGLRIVQFHIKNDCCLTQKFA